MRAEISFSKLFTYTTADSNERVPIENLADGANHVHGLLQLEIDGRALPHVGFFGPDDVCFNTWVQELSDVVRELGANADAKYTFDEGEQGQPAFEFRRSGDLVFVSVVDSELSGATGDPKFRNVGCTWSEFSEAVSGFFVGLRSELRSRCPNAADTWWQSNAREAV